MNKTLKTLSQTAGRINKMDYVRDVEEFFKRLLASEILIEPKRSAIYFTNLQRTLKATSLLMSFFYFGLGL
mgnify:CR=1 FL=1